MESVSTLDRSLHPGDTGKETKCNRKKKTSSLSSLSRSITGSLRVRKRRSVARKSEASLCHPSSRKSGYFDIVNKSISVCEWESWCNQTASCQSRGDGETVSVPRRHGNASALNYTVVASESLFAHNKTIHPSSSHSILLGESCSEPSKALSVDVARGSQRLPLTRRPQRSSHDERSSKFRKISSSLKPRFRRLAPEGAEDSSSSSSDQQHNSSRSVVGCDKSDSERCDSSRVASPAPPPLPPRVPTTGGSSHTDGASSSTSRSSGSGSEDSSRSYRSFQKETYSKWRHNRSAIARSKKTSTSDALHVSLCGGLVEKNTGRVYGRLYNRKQSLNCTFAYGHRSLAVHEDVPLSLPSQRLVTASSVNNMTRQLGPHGDHQAAGTSGGKAGAAAGRVAGWAVNFDRLLQDPMGLAVFTTFLKKEFSEENVIFWTACEQYRKISDEQLLKSQAHEIYSRHLSSKASDPVNVDSMAKSHTERFLENPTAVMFDVAQQQIFQLMRQDSYSRFLKSELYKNYLLMEIEGRELIDPVTGKPESDGINSSGKGDKKKNKGKENEEKRRRSILPWRQNKKSLKSTSDSDVKKLGKKVKEEKPKEKEPNNNTNEESSNLNVVIGGSNPAAPSGVTHTKKPAGPGIDLSTMRKEVFHPKEIKDAPESQFKFCRIMLPDGSTTVVCAKPGQSCRVVLTKLCEKKSISLAAVEVFLRGSSKALDLDEDISVLGSKEIVIEKAVFFRLDLPNRNSIGVKARPNRSVYEVFKPILQKFGHNIESITVHISGNLEPVDLEERVSCLDNQRVTIAFVDATEGPDPDRLPLSARQAKAVMSGKGKSSGGGRSGGGSLEEITNQIFDDLMRGKSQMAHRFDELGVFELEKSKANNKNEEGRSLGLFGLLRRESWAAKDKRAKNKGKVTFTLPGSDGRKKKDKDGENLINLLSGAQDMRLEDQRGTEVSPGEMPSFLQHQHHEAPQDTHRTPQPEVLEVHMGQRHAMYQAATERGLDLPTHSKTPPLHDLRNRKHNGADGETSTGVPTPRPSWSTSQPVVTPRGKAESPVSPVNPLASSEKWSHQSNRSFGPDSIIPSPNIASAYFQMSPEIIDAQNHLFTSPSPRPSYSSHVGGRSLSSDFDSYKPFHSTYHSSFSPSPRAPVFSPETFSPQNNGGHALMILPSKMSPSRSSNSSSSSSSSTHPHAVPVSRASPQSISRMSDGMLLHKLQRAQKSKIAQRSSNHSSSNSHQLESNSLSQRALLSPRFNDSSQRSLEEENQTDIMSHFQRALLSPRFNHSSHSISTPSSHYGSNKENNSSHHHVHNKHNNQTSIIPSPARSSPSSMKNYGNDVSFIYRKPMSSAAGPQLSCSLYLSPSMAGQDSAHTYSPVMGYPAGHTDSQEDLGETVTFV